MTNLLNNYIVSIVAIIGLVVLVALNKVDSATAVPIITGLVGLHINTANTVPVPVPAPAPTPAQFVSPVIVTPPAPPTA